MSSEIGSVGSEYYEIIKAGSSFSVTEALTAARRMPFVPDRGISYINSNWTEDDDEELFLSETKEKDELFQFHKDPDYDDEEFREFGFKENTGNLHTYDSLLPYDFETDTVDKLNLDKQIESYAANFWEFVSIVGDTILFKRPRSV